MSVLRKPRRSAQAANQHRSPIESLEARRLLSISWVNRGTGPGAADTDNFNATFGANAAQARILVDRAIVDWEEVITNFNYNGGGNNFSVTVRTEAISSIASGGVTAINNGKPTAGLIRIQNNAATHYIDPTAGDDAEFTTLTNPFTGFAPGVTATDLYATMIHELGHVLGMSSNPNVSLQNFITNTGIDDPNSGTAGNLLAFNVGGGPIEATFTASDPGHLWEGPATTATTNAGLPFHVDELMNPGRAIAPNERNLISDLTASILRDAYGYTITMPSTLNNMLVNPNFTTNALQVSGLGGSDVIVIQGTAVPGQLHCSVGPFTEIVPLSEVSTINVNGGENQDFIRLEFNAGRPTTLSGDGGDDFIDFSFGARNLGNITGNTVAIGGSGVDRIFVYDNNVAAAQTYTVTAFRFDRPGWGGFSYASDIESETLTTSTAADTVNVQSTFANQPVVIASAGGGDTVNIGNASNGVRSIASDVQIQNDPSFTTLNINNGPDTVARNATINQFGGGFGVLSGLAPANIFWDNADIQNITVTAGSGEDILNVLRCSERLFLRNNNGVDRYNLGNSTSGMNEVTAAIDIGPNGAFVFADVYVNDSGTSTSRNYSWARTGAGYTLTGAPAPIFYQSVFTLDIQAGAGNDSFTLTGIDDNFINIHGNGGFDTLVVDDRSMPFAFVSSLMTPNALSRNDGQIFTTVIDTVYDGLESLTFFAHPSSTTMDVTGVPSSIPAGQQATIVLGNNVDTVNLYPQDGNGDLTINGNLGINGNGGSDTLRVRNNGSAGGTYSLSNPFGSGTQNLFGVGTGGLGTALIENWELNGGSGDDTWNINQFTSGVSLAINGGDGQDTVNYGNNGLGQVTNMTSFNFNGQDGYDTFFLNNQTHTGTWTYTRNLNAIFATSTLGANYSLSESNNELIRLNGGPSAETFNINSSTQGGIIIDAAAGADLLRLGVASNNVEGIQGAVNFQVGGDGGRVQVLDTADTTGDTFHLDQQFLGAAPGDNLFGPGGFLSFNGLTDNGANPALLINCGSGSDVAFAQPLASGTTTINFGAQNFGEGVVGDQLNLALAAAENYVINGTTNGNVTSTTTGQLNWTSVELPVAVDDVAPSVVSADLIVDAPAMALIQDFSEEINPAVSLSSLTLTNLDTNELVPYANMALAYSATSVTITFPGYDNGVLPDGNYRLDLSAGYATDLFGNTSIAPFQFDTFALAGDANRDRSVNISDFAILAANFNSGTTFSQGDFDYSGLTNISDFAILAAKFNQSLPAAPMTAARSAVFGGRLIAENELLGELI